jgi:choline-sulfatase
MGALLRCRSFRRALAMSALAAVCVGCSDPVEGTSRNLLLVTIDTLRPDHLGAYGYGLETSPHLDQLAENSVVFDRAYGTSSWTLPSVASLLTAEYPSGHRTRSNRSSLAPGFETLAESLQSAGFATSAVVSHVFFARRYGLDQGFDQYDDVLVREQTTDSHKLISSPDITAKAVAWLEQRQAADDGRRWFLWLHYFDPHFEYITHPETRERFDGKPMERYDGEIAFTDFHLGKLFAKLEELGAARDTLTIVASDHGEAFGERGFTGHRLSLFEEELRVALLIRAPEIAPRRVSLPVSLVDVAPTALELLRIAPPPVKAGISLVPLLNGRPLVRPPIIAELRSALDWRRVDGIVTRGWKLTHHRVLGLSLYNLITDPDERLNLASAKPAVTMRLRAEMQRRIAAARLRGEAMKSLPAEPIDPLLQQQLEALGYAEPPAAQSPAPPLLP